ncbi:hypothetical protein [Pelagicoccus sp. SDUM812002]|uniref:hypothetical protein n=1 Tax=Pelagicoccus sp. SDUM812002 TaxID=3041266 RepID=UPI00280FBA18|nr:hypothetical protein [Pelagicoccus sp. SDUM812002]MDQ8187609.1 hypothetical protein [Pelagicoccus sp. SDUM812002]
MKDARFGQILEKGRDLHGSPFNLVNTEPFVRNLERLKTVGCTHDLDIATFFARKANKCLSFVHACRENGYGVDVASEIELDQALRCGVASGKIACTAAVKSRSLLSKCLERDVCVVLDNSDEIDLAVSLARDSQKTMKVALRLSGFEHAGLRLESRFGFPVGDIGSVLSDHVLAHLELAGLHFHLDGYCYQQRVSALWQCLDVSDWILQKKGVRLGFIDCGGGVPISYLASAEQWQGFWSRHDAALLGTGDPVTFDNDGYGRVSVDGRLFGNVKRYPFYQELVQEEWLAKIVNSSRRGETLGGSLAGRRLQLRLEPGRSALDGCGVTVAEVAYRKRHSNGQILVGLAMNHTQCRTSSVDFFADPLLYRCARPMPDQREVPTDSGFLVGSYCTESEFLSLREFRFPEGIAVGDLVVFPNTAGYFMHFKESRSHQFPLAKNLVVTPREVRLDQIDW